MPCCASRFELKELFDMRTASAKKRGEEVNNKGTKSIPRQPPGNTVRRAWVEKQNKKERG